MERERGKQAAGEAVEPGPDADPLSLAQVEAVLRRAVQLEAEQRTPGVPGLSVAELTRVALEAGLSPAAIDAAIRELELGALSSGEQKQAWLDRRLGPSTVRAGRVVWGAQEGLRANMLRTVRRGWAGGRDWRRVEITSQVRPLDERSIVSLQARLEGRGGMAAGFAALAGGSALGALVLAVSGIAQLAGHSPDAVQLFVASGAVAATGGAVSALVLSSSAKAWQAKLRRMRASLDKLLEGI